MLEEMDEFASTGDSFVFETTLSGKGYVKKIKQWQACGYSVSLLYLSLPDVRIAIERVAERVKQGGHNIPEAVIRRRFLKGLNNFNRIYQQIVNDWAIYDNSGTQPVLMDWGINSEI